VPRSAGDKAVRRSRQREVIARTHEAIHAPCVIDRIRRSDPRPRSGRDGLHSLRREHCRVPLLARSSAIKASPPATAERRAPPRAGRPDLQSVLVMTRESRRHAIASRLTPRVPRARRLRPAPASGPLHRPSYTLACWRISRHPIVGVTLGGSPSTWAQHRQRQRQCSSSGFTIVFRRRMPIAGV
jgi:hypothetical protein